MSAGSRSGVNWMRCQRPPSAVAIALARVVLPTPGTSSMSRCPPANRQVSASLTAVGLPRKAICTASAIAWYALFISLPLAFSVGGCAGWFGLGRRRRVLRQQQRENREAELGPVVAGPV